MNRIDNNKVFCGLDTNTLFQKMDNNFVYAQNKEDIIFEPNSEGQLDFALWVSLIFNANPLGLISKSLNGLARMLGYVPKSGKGKINDKIKKSLDRLQDRMYLNYNYVDNEYNIVIDLSPQDGSFFKLYYSNIVKILNLDNYMFDMSEEARIKRELTHYKDRTKALYIYCYLLSRMGIKQVDINKNTQNIEVCYPTLEQISEDCNVDIKTLRRLLALFEMDGLIYTTNIGNVLLDNVIIPQSNNYYTTSISCLNGTFRYSEVYYLTNGYKVSNYDDTNKKIVKDISNLLSKATKKLSDAKFNIDGKGIKVLPIFDKMVENNFNNILNSSIDTNVNKDDFELYMEKKLYQKSKHSKTTKNKSLLYLMDKSTMPTTLIHYRNTLRGILVLFGLY